MGNLPFGPNRCPNMESKSHAAPVSPDRHQTIWACLKEHWKVFPKGTLFFVPMRVVLKESLNVLIVPIIVLQQFAVLALPIN